MNIYYSDSFQKELDKLFRKDKKYRERVRKTIGLMWFDIGHPSLRIHKLKDIGVYSVSVDMKIRIIFDMVDEEITLLHIGTHDQVY
jgi:mRNA-degrading endonuclease YafQ of YafQ-DinJ toxin-antitoxin module